MLASVDRSSLGLGALGGAGSNLRLGEWQELGRHDRDDLGLPVAGPDAAGALDGDQVTHTRREVGQLARRAQTIRRTGLESHVDDIIAAIGQIAEREVFVKCRVSANHPQVCYDRRVQARLAVVVETCRPHQHACKTSEKYDEHADATVGADGRHTRHYEADGSEADQPREGAVNTVHKDTPLVRECQRHPIMQYYTIFIHKTQTWITIDLR